MAKYSEQWSLMDDGRIVNDEGKFYSVEKGPYGNPVILQPTAGRIFVTFVGEKVLCEKEKVYEALGQPPSEQLRVVRASLDNPSQPKAMEPRLIGLNHSNTARIFGAADEVYIQELDENPNPEKYTLCTFAEVAKSKDGIGKAAVFMAYAEWDDEEEDEEGCTCKIN
jgi:hypothetical protein